MSISQEYARATRTHREEGEEGGGRGFSHWQGVPCHNPDGEEVAESVCGVPDSLKWNSPFQGFEAFLGHVGGH